MPKITGLNWLDDIAACVDALGDRFTLQEMYEYIDVLREFYPNNNNIDAKIRQSLQVLRDQGEIFFIARGVYGKK